MVHQPKMLTLILISLISEKKKIKRQEQIHSRMITLFSMLTLSIIFSNSASLIVKADLVIKPRDTEAAIGDSAYFDCASNVNFNEILWYHHAVGANDYEDVCLYFLGRIHPQYEHRIIVERNFSTGNTRLLIKSVQSGDAGRYECQDNGGIGESTSSQLVILESTPICTWNMKPDGVLGPNSCGLEPDTLQLSCRVSYLGNIPPVINWRKSGTNDLVNSSLCHHIGNRMTCTLTTTFDLGLNGATYICETNRSTTTPYKCMSGNIRIIYVNPDDSITKITEGAENSVCSVNSSQLCTHTWIRLDEIDGHSNYYGSTLVNHKPGWYQCKSLCYIRGKQCAFLSKMVHISEPRSSTMPLINVASFVVAFVALFVCFGLVCFFCLRKRKNKQKHLQTRKEKVLSADSKESSVSPRPMRRQRTNFGTKEQTKEQTSYGEQLIPLAVTTKACIEHGTLTRVTSFNFDLLSEPKRS